MEIQRPRVSSFLKFLKKPFDFVERSLHRLPRFLLVYVMILLFLNLIYNGLLYNSRDLMMEKIQLIHSLGTQEQKLVKVLLSLSGGEIINIADCAVVYV